MDDFWGGASSLQSSRASGSGEVGVSQSSARQSGSSRCKRKGTEAVAIVLDADDSAGLIFLNC